MKTTGQRSLSQIFQLIKSKLDNLSKVATTGSYNDLSDLPDIDTSKFLRVDTVVSADSSNTISIPFTPGTYETVMVYLNGLLLIENTHYIMNSDSTITLPDYVVNQGDVFTFINKTVSPLELEIKADAKNSESWAVGGTGVRVGEDTNNSKYWSQQAKSSETASKTSETNARKSEESALSSSTSAASSASAAKTSETNAKTSETNADKSEANAKTSETNAKASETSAANSASAAKTSETNAKTSETNAKKSETNAATSDTSAAVSASVSSESALESQSWAIGGTGTRQGEDENNAKYWAEQARDFVGGDFVSIEELEEAISAIPTPDVSGQIEEHNTSEESHADIRAIIDDYIADINCGEFTDTTSKNNIDGGLF